MKQKYFGFLKDSDFPEGDRDLEIEYLQEISVLEDKPSFFGIVTFDYIDELYSESIDNPGIHNHYYNIMPNVLQAYYKFLINHYQEKIDTSFIRFSLDLNKQLFGFNKKEQKKIALKTFKKIFSKIDCIWEVSENNLYTEGIENLKSISRIDLLKKYREDVKDGLNIYDESFKNYLLGEIIFFNDSLIKSRSNLESAIDFESKLKKLLSLNNRFKFEEDYYFGVNNQLKERFQRHSELSFNFQVFKFIYECITKIEKSEYANIVSLYYFLFDTKIIREDPNTFQNFINNEFNLDISRIKIDNITNKKHLQRIEDFSDLWGKLNQQK